VLTKPLGVGIVAFAGQVGRAPEEGIERISASMSALNRTAGEWLIEHEARAATDVTGFSLMGHLSEVVRNSGVEVELDFDAIPFFAGVGDLARAEVLPGAVERNREAVAETMLDFEGLAAAQASMLFCPETSGGILAFLPAERAEGYVSALRAGGVEDAAVIGRVAGERAGGLIRVRTSRAAEFTPLEVKPAAAAPAEAAEGPGASCCPSGGAPEPKAEGDTLSCCQTGPAGAETGGLLVPAAASESFGGYMAAVNAPGALDTREKKLIALALSVVSKCGPCVKINTAAAREAGASDAQISEAVALGIAFGGAPTNMFYNQLRSG
jgi:AhpD family alkylhydroperoxidase